MNNFMMGLALLLLNLLWWQGAQGQDVQGKSAQAQIAVTDNVGREVVLAQPAQRIISLAPHVTENLFSAGAGEQVVGVVDYSNYPKAATQVPSVGSFVQLNLEAIVALNPDLVVAWHSGHGDMKLQSLLDLGLTVYVSDPRDLETVAVNIENFGTLSGHHNQALQAAQAFRLELSRLRQQYSQLAPVGVFYQVWNNPLQTLNGSHLISDVIRLCGGYNVFADAIAIAPKLAVESVLAANPQAIVASGMGEARPDWLDEWLQWPSLQAVQGNHLYFIPPDYVQRHTVRILLGADMLCRQLQQVRSQ
ncbi:MAG: cobalamin-binding protein [Candidatus Pelagadaptatus aseana]|uniref:cobalamin-binding protein n=1 Tax=Candidatus Pelagadaptatus aseana TaxID=3120508 RepID=UPI0039B192BA